MAHRKTQQQIITEFIAVHGHRYDYNKTIYTNGNTKVIISCPMHGDFTQQPRAHIAGQGCPQCTQKPNWQYGRKDYNYFLTQAIARHNNRYNYRDYVCLSKPVTISCSIHGDFRMKAAGHLNGRGCPKCANNQKKKLADFIAEATTIHGTQYDYRNSEYVSTNTPITIVCTKHGEFTQTPTSHLAGHGCQQCGEEKCAIINLKTGDDFITKATNIHGMKYDYSAVEYHRATTPVTIICRSHGPFHQRPRDHVNSNNGCPHCAGNRKLTTEEFVERAQTRWNNRYSYEQTIYTTGKERVIVTCPRHGNFTITAAYHLGDGGCPHCAMSTEQHDLTQFVKSIYGNNIKSNDRTAIAPFELDLHIPERRLAIELNGIYFHSYNHQESIAERERHRHKHSLCVTAGISLLQFTDYEWNNKRELVKSMIANKLGLSTRIAARSCEITTEIPPNFFRENHIHGFKANNAVAGLTIDGEIVCAMSWSKHAKYGWEICRLATKLGIHVVGGAGKLLKWFIRTHSPKTVFTYADKRFSIGNVYRSLGFIEIGSTRPNYQYVDRLMKPHSRIKFQKHKLNSLLEIFDPNTSESVNMFNNGYRRLWDAGHYRFLLSLGH